MIAHDLAEWVVSIDDAPRDARRAARPAATRSLLDGLGTALGALRLGAAEPAVHVAAGLGGPPEAAVLGSRVRIGAPAAALATGALVHALDFDDTHAGGLVHATAVVLPAVWTVGQQCDISGEDALMAAITGLEVACRVAGAAPNGFHARGLHSTMVAGVFASAAVAARLMKLSADQTANALGIAGSSAGGLLAFLGTQASTKQLHPGLASQAGIIAARLAAAGATGPETVFDGPNGVYDALADGRPNLASLVEGLGVRWEVTRIGIKPYPVCQLSHAALDALRDAQRQGFDVDDVVEVLARLHPDSAMVVADPRRDLTRPVTPYAAKFSLPWCAAALLRGPLSSETITEQVIADPSIRELAARVRVEIADADVPAADAPGWVQVRLRDGRVVVGQVTRSSGGPDNPLSREDLRSKFRANVGSPADELVSVLDELAEQPNLGRLVEQAARHADAYHRAKD